MIKRLNDGHSFSLHKTLTDGLALSELLWCIYQLVELPFWRHPFTAEDPLVKKWYNAKFLQIKNKLIYIADGLRVKKFSASVHFGVKYSFNYIKGIELWIAIVASVKLICKGGT